jgi:hypothetical protein
LRGLASDNADGFIATTDLTGYAYFDVDSDISEDDVTNALKDAFRKYNKLFLEILAESDDAFLSDIRYAIVIVDGDSVLDRKVTNESSDETFPIWAIALVAAGAGFALVVGLCLCFIYCLGEPDEDQDGVYNVSRTNSRETKKSKSTTASSTPDEEESTMYDHEHFEARSFSSQDSSKFTFNPKSVFSNTNTFASFNTNMTNIDNHVQNWQRDSTIEQGSNTAFGNDVSAINEKRDLSHIDEREEESAESFDAFNLHGDRQYQSRNNRQSSLRNSGRPSGVSGGAKEVMQDLDDLSQQVAMYRTSSS